MGKRISPIAWIVAGPIILFGPMLLRGEALFWGTPLLQFVPWREQALAFLAGGHLPLWNPGLGMGAPLFANYQSALAYPPNFLLALTGPAYGHGLLVMLHLIWAGIGTVLLLRGLGAGTLGQVIGGLSYSLSGALVARSGFLTINAAVAWLPWIVVAADRLVLVSSERGGWKKVSRQAIWLAVAFGMQWLAGHAQMSWYTLCLVGIWVTWRGIASGARVRSWAWVAAAGVAGFGLAAVQLIPTAEYWLESSRGGGIAEDLALTYSLWPWRLTGLILPGLFGSPAAGDYWGYGNFWEDALYPGLLPLAFALWSAWRGIRGRGTRPGLVRLLLCVIAGSILLALGKNTPVFPFLYQYVPTFDWFQAPARWLLLTAFPLAVLAGLAADDWRSPTGRSLYWSRLGTVGAAVLAVSALAWSHRFPEIQVSFIRAFAAAGVIAFLAGLLHLFQARLSPTWLTAIAATFVLGDLVFAGQGLNPSAPLSTFREASTLVETAAPDHRLWMPADLEYDLKFERFFRFDTYDIVTEWRGVRDAGLPNSPALEALPSANNFDPLVPHAYAAWMDALQSVREDRLEAYLRLMDVGWSAVADPGSATGVGYIRVEDSARVRMIREVEWVDSRAAALRRAFDPGFDLEDTVILEGPAVGFSAGDSEATVELHLEDDPNRVAVSVSGSGGGWLVLSDTWYPGWRATVDGEPAEIHRADGLFRAVWVESGDHHIEFRYAPASFTAGLLLTVATALALVWVGWRCRRD